MRALRTGIRPFLLLLIPYGELAQRVIHVFLLILFPYGEPELGAANCRMFFIAQTMPVHSIKKIKAC
jgi:hypothetical protein